MKLYRKLVLATVLSAAVIGGAAPALADPALTQAQDLTLRGSSIIDPSLLTALFTGLAAVISAIGTLLFCNRRAARHESALRSQIATDLRAKIVNDPLRVAPQPVYVTCDQCDAHRAAISKRIDRLQPILERISAQVETNGQRAEERAVQLHRRLDPIVERVAANSAKIELLEQRPN